MSEMGCSKTAELICFINDKIGLQGSCGSRSYGQRQISES